MSAGAGLAPSRWAGLLIALAALAPSASWSAPRIEIDTSPMEPQVARVIEKGLSAVRSNPESAAAWGRLGALFHAHELYEHAEDCYREANRLAPREFRHAYLLAIASSLVGRPIEETVPLFEAAAALQPSYPPVWLYLGDVLIRHGNLEAGEANCRRALELDPNFAAAHRSLGQILLAQGNVEEAISHLERAAAAAPADRGVNASLAAAYRAAGRDDDARAAAERARSQDVALGYEDSIQNEVKEMAVGTSALTQRGRALLDEGNYEKAIQNLKIVVAVHPDFVGAHSMLGRAYEGAGQRADAIRHLERALALAPERTADMARLSRLYLYEGKDDLARRWATAALEKSPDDPDANNVLGMVLVGEKSFPAAIACFEKVEQGGSSTPNTYSFWGIALAQSGRADEAIAKFRRTIELDPNHVSALYNLAFALEQTGRIPEAIDAYRAAVKIEPRHPLAGRLAALTAGAGAAAGAKPR